jgi:hypothetical protein
MLVAKPGALLCHQIRSGPIDVGNILTPENIKYCLHHVLVTAPYLQEFFLLILLEFKLK